MTKNGKPRTFKMTAELRQLLQRQLVEHERLKKKGHIVPHVFHRERLVKQADRTWTPQEGQPIRSFTKAWRADCESAGFPGRIFHDLRRSAIRNFVRSGIGEQVAMQLSGHLTPSVFRRYNITDDVDLDVAADNLDAAAVQPVKRREPRTARVRPFRRRA